MLLSRGRLLLDFSLFFADSSFLRLCVGVSMSMPSSEPKQTRKVSSCIFGVRVCSFAGLARWWHRSRAQLVSCGCSATSPASAAPGSHFACGCSCCLNWASLGRFWRWALLNSEPVLVLVVSCPSAAAFLQTPTVVSSYMSCSDACEFVYTVNASPATCCKFYLLMCGEIVG